MNGGNVIPLKDDIPSRTTPIVTHGLIVLNLLAFLLELGLSSAQMHRLVYTFGFDPVHFREAMRAGLYTAAFLPVLTSMFLHAGWLHFGGNMLFLYIFGDNVEDRLGHARFLFYYLACGTVAALLQASVAPNVSVPMIGASGAIAGVLGGYFVMFPHARVLTLFPIFLIFPIIPLPASWFLGIWIIVQVINGSMALGMNAAVGGVAWIAHVSGFFAGLVMVRVLRKR